MAVRTAEKLPLRNVHQFKTAENPKSQLDSEHQPELSNPKYYYDVASSQFLLGKVALEYHLEAGGHPSDILPLEVVLRSKSLIDIDERDSSPLVASKPSKKAVLSYIGWLMTVSSEPQQPHERSLNREIIVNSSRLGLGYKLSNIRSSKMFPNLRTVYEVMDAPNTHRIANYHQKFVDWEPSDFVDYVKKVSERLGKKPNQAELDKLSRRSKRNPNSHLIAERLGGLRRALELAGFPDIHSWTKDEYIDWGVKVRRANGGSEIRTTMVEYLSYLKRGPSDLTIRRKFEGVQNFQQAVEVTYQANEQARQERREAKLVNIYQMVDDGCLPPELVPDGLEEDEKIIRYARWLVLDELLDQSSQSDKVSIAMMRTRDAKQHGLIGAIRNLNDSISAGDIESTALYLDVFDELWPLDDFMQDLRVPDRIKSDWRKKLTTGKL